VKLKDRPIIKYEEVNDMHCFVFTCIFIIFYCTFINVNHERSLKENYYLTNEISSNFGGKGMRSKNFHEIDNKNQFYEYLNTTLKDLLF